MKTLFCALLLVAGVWSHSHHDHDHDSHGHDHHNHDHHDHQHTYDHHHDHNSELPKQPVVVSPSGEFRGGYNVTRRGRQFETYRGIRYAEPPVGELRFQLPKQPVVVSPSGEFRGGYNVTRRGRQFETYRGIRYAEPPVGELRFQPPKLISEYKSPVDAREDGPACPLPAPPGYPVDEDCLTINVYTPLKKDRSKPLPVIFFMHPGGFYSMTGRSDLAGPHYLLDRDLVLVTINYRLGSLGFLSTGDKLAPGNNAFKDQVAALQWVQRNIAAFGGDPNCVTIAGTSAGSISVMLHMISPMSKGLFHRGISMSGSPVMTTPTPDNYYQLAVKQAELLNCPTTNSKVIIDCLKTKPWRELGDSLSGFYEFGFDPILIWGPVIEKDFGQERFLSIEPADAIKQGKMHTVPYIVSQSQDEFFWMAFTVLRNQTLRDKMNAEWESVAPISFLLPPRPASAAAALRRQYLHDRPLRDDEQSATDLGLLYQDSIESFPIHRLVNLMSRHSQHPVWYYEFAYIGNHSHYEDPVTKKPVGAAHHDDLIYLFTLSYRFPDIGTSGADSDTVDVMTSIWYNFAKNGDPNKGDVSALKGIKWPRILPDDRKYLRIDNELSVKKNLKEDRMKLWEELYPMEY